MCKLMGDRSLTSLVLRSLEGGTIQKEGLIGDGNAGRTDLVARQGYTSKTIRRSSGETSKLFWGGGYEHNIDCFGPTGQRLFNVLERAARLCCQRWHFTSGR